MGAFVLVLSKLMRCVSLYVGLNCGRERATSWGRGVSGGDQQHKRVACGWAHAFLCLVNGYMLCGGQ